MLVDPRDGTEIALPAGAAVSLGNGVGVLVYLPLGPLPGRPNVESDPPRYCAGEHERADDCEWVELAPPLGAGPLWLRLPDGGSVDVRAVDARLQRLRDVAEWDAVQSGMLLSPAGGTDSPGFWTGDAGADERLRGPSALAALSAWWERAHGAWDGARWVWRCALMRAPAVRPHGRAFVAALARVIDLRPDAIAPGEPGGAAYAAIVGHEVLSTMRGAPGSFVREALVRWPSLDLARELAAAGDFLLARPGRRPTDVRAFVASWCARAASATALPSAAASTEPLPMRDLLPWMAHVALEGGVVTGEEASRALGLEPAELLVMAEKGRAVAERVRERLTAMRAERAGHTARRDE